jgi:hypothetical protein
MASDLGERLRRLPYALVCTLLGLGLGWFPYLLHGPIPEKFNPHFIQGAVVVWAYYGSRMAIGFLVGISVWPRAWWQRGPLLGALVLVPPGLLSLSVPECGPT